MSKFTPYHFLVFFLTLTILFGFAAKHYQAEVKSYELCLLDAKSAPEKAIHTCKDKAQIVAELVIEHDKLEKCDAAILQDYSSDDCPASVQALALENAAAKARILQFEKDQAQFVQRAETRTQTILKKKTQDVKAIEKAKASSIGNTIICDTKCLRDRFEN